MAEFVEKVVDTSVESMVCADKLVEKITKLGINFVAHLILPSDLIIRDKLDACERKVLNPLYQTLSQINSSSCDFFKGQFWRRLAATLQVSRALGFSVIMMLMLS